MHMNATKTFLAAGLATSLSVLAAVVPAADSYVRLSWTLADSGLPVALLASEDGGSSLAVPDALRGAPAQAWLLGADGVPERLLANPRTAGGTVGLLFLNQLAEPDRVVEVGIWVGSLYVPLAHGSGGGGSQQATSGVSGPEAAGPHNGKVAPHTIIPCGNAGGCTLKIYQLPAMTLVTTVSMNNGDIAYLPAGFFGILTDA
jgi:hypothetical protein